MRQNKANPAVRDRVNTVINHPLFRELLKELRQLKWRRDSSGKPIGDLDKVRSATDPC
jgi:hypothetical protein